MSTYVPIGNLQTATRSSERIAKRPSKYNEVRVIHPKRHIAEQRYQNLKTTN
jgi:hypothetical protein